MVRRPAREPTATRATLQMVAKLHYESDMPQVEIARKIGVSTASVSRMLQRARDLGIVKIEVMDLAPAEEIGVELSELLGLKRVMVTEVHSNSVLGALAEPLGVLMKDQGLKASSVVGIGWGRAVREVLSVGLPRIPGVRAVALNGGMQQSAAHFQINEFVRRAAEQMGGSAHFLHAPYLSSAELRDAFLNDPFVRETASLWDNLDCAIVGIGLPPHALESTGIGLATTNEQAITGAAGDVIRHYFDIDGTSLPWEGEERMIAATRAQLRKAVFSIGIAASVEKARTIVGAARSGMINALVTDTSTAHAILDVVRPLSPAI